MNAAAEDGNLPAALTRLERAVDALIQPKTAFIENKLRCAPSMYMQLWDSIEGEQGEGDSGGSPAESAPIWVSAFDLRNEIDFAIECLQPAFTGVPPTVGRLRMLPQRKWRPQDVRHMDQISSACEEWLKKIEEALNPQPRKHISAPCPACGAEIVKRRDSTGVLVRQPALQIVPEQGCTCMSCRYTWPPDHYLLLCGALGYPLPKGVLE